MSDMFFLYATALSSQGSIEVSMHKHSFSRTRFVEMLTIQTVLEQLLLMSPDTAVCALPTQPHCRKGRAGSSHTSDCRQGSSGLWVLEKVIHQRVGLELIMSLRLKCLTQLQPLVNKGGGGGCCFLREF